MISAAIATLLDGDAAATSFIFPKSQPADPGTNNVERPITDVVKSSLPAIARIHLMGVAINAAGQKVSFVRTGTAFLIDRTGDLLTNCHVASTAELKLTGPLTVTAEFADNHKRVSAQVRGCLPQAVLIPPGPADWPIRVRASAASRLLLNPRPSGEYPS
jgi:S1-C subfamily serine protease